MFELPGLTATGDTARDLETVRRYLVRLIPQLEMELAEAKADRFSDAYNTRTAGMVATQSSGQAKDGAAALADHLLDRQNPHHVTAQQLGLSLDSVAARLSTEHATKLRLGGKQGLEVLIQQVSTSILGSAWTLGEAMDTVTIDLGAWEQAMAMPWSAQATLVWQSKGEQFLGALSGTTSRLIGSVQIFRPHVADEIPEEETRLILRMTAIGGYGYGG